MHNHMSDTLELNLSLCVRKPIILVPTRSNINLPVHLQKMAGRLKFQICEVEGLYYPCSENKGDDQLRSYCEADLRLWFRICSLSVFSCSGSFKLILTNTEIILKY